MKLKLETTGDCNNCPFWKMRGSSIPGRLIPGGYGKCTAPIGICTPTKIRAKKTFEEVVSRAEGAAT
jgi:hypothetical protein